MISSSQMNSGNQKNSGQKNLLFISGIFEQKKKKNIKEGSKIKKSNQSCCWPSNVFRIECFSKKNLPQYIICE